MPTCEPQGVADCLRTAFPYTTPGFIGLLDRFLEQRDNIFKGPYLTVPLPFRSGTKKGKPPFAWLPDSFVPHVHQAKAFARLMAQDARDFHGLVHEADGKLLGLTHYVFHPNLWRDEGVCYVQDLYTATEAGGRGVARART